MLAVGDILDAETVGEKAPATVGLLSENGEYPRLVGDENWVLMPVGIINGVRGLIKEELFEKGDATDAGEFGTDAGNSSSISSSASCTS